MQRADSRRSCWRCTAGAKPTGGTAQRRRSSRPLGSCNNLNCFDVCSTHYKGQPPGPCQPILMGMLMTLLLSS